MIKDHTLAREDRFVWRCNGLLITGMTADFEAQYDSMYRAVKTRDSKTHIAHHPQPKMLPDAILGPKRVLAAKFLHHLVGGIGEIRFERCPRRRRIVVFEGP